jgi:hypothetical protein
MTFPKSSTVSVIQRHGNKGAGSRVRSFPEGVGFGKARAGSRWPDSLPSIKILAPTEKSLTGQRIASLDAFRDATIAIAMLVKPQKFSSSQASLVVVVPVMARYRPSGDGKTHRPKSPAPCQNKRVWPCKSV